MLRVAAICGCALPNTDFFAKFIGEEIRVFLLDFGYESLTLAEILLAFRLNAKAEMKYPGGQDLEHVHFTGKCLNVDYMASVLENYMIFRKTFDRSLQNKLDGYEL
jgi:hypothetical protein